MANNTADAIETSTTTVLNVNMTNITKLSSNNYLMWSLQVHALLDGYGLAGYLDGSTAPPPPTITTNNVVAVNPAHVTWNRQDRLIYSGLLGAVSLMIQPILSRSTTSAAIWRTFADTYASTSWGHICQLRLQLKQWSKQNMTIDEYIQGIVTKFDQLALLGKPVEHEDQVEYGLDGLPEEFKSVVDQLEGRDRTPTITEVHEKLLNHEAKLLIAAAVVPSIVPTSANTANLLPRFSQHRKSSPSHQPWTPSSAQKHNPNHKQNNKNTKGYQGKCQICSTFGHSADMLKFVP